MITESNSILEKHSPSRIIISRVCFLWGVLIAAVLCPTAAFGNPPLAIFGGVHSVLLVTVFFFERWWCGGVPRLCHKCWLTVWFATPVYCHVLLGGFVHAGPLSSVCILGCFAEFIIFKRTKRLLLLLLYTAVIFTVLVFVERRFTLFNFMQSDLASDCIVAILYLSSVASAVYVSRYGTRLSQAEKDMSTVRKVVKCIENFDYSIPISPEPSPIELELHKIIEHVVMLKSYLPHGVGLFGDERDENCVNPLETPSASTPATASSGGYHLRGEGASDVFNVPLRRPKAKTDVGSCVGKIESSSLETKKASVLCVKMTNVWYLKQNDKTVVLADHELSSRWKDAIGIVESSVKRSKGTLLGVWGNTAVALFSAGSHNYNSVCCALTITQRLHDHNLLHSRMLDLNSNMADEDDLMRSVSEKCFRDQRQQVIQMYCGIASGKFSFGHLSTRDNSYRCFHACGGPLECAMSLSLLAETLDKRILLHEAVYSSINEMVHSIPVDIVEVSPVQIVGQDVVHSDAILVYEALKEREQIEEEWMYEFGPKQGPGDRTSQELASALRVLSHGNIRVAKEVLFSIANLDSVHPVNLVQEECKKNANRLLNDLPDHESGKSVKRSQNLSHWNCTYTGQSPVPVLSLFGDSLRLTRTRDRDQRSYSTDVNDTNMLSPAQQTTDGIRESTSENICERRTSGTSAASEVECIVRNTGGFTDLLGLI